MIQGRPPVDSRRNPGALPGLRSGARPRVRATVGRRAVFMLAARGRKTGAVIVMALVSCVNAPSGEAETGITPQRGHGPYLFAWAGDPDGRGSDFLAVTAA